MAKTFYDVLEVSGSAGQEMIRTAHDSMVRTYAAKAQAGDADADNRLKFVRTAYEVLSNPQKKALYDQRMAASTQPVAAVVPDKRVIPKKVETQPHSNPALANPHEHPGGFGRVVVAIIMGFFSGLMIYFLAAMVFAGHGSGPSTAFVFVTLFGGWVLSAYVMQKGAISVSKVFSRGFLVGAAEWLLVIPAGMIFAGRVVASSVDGASSSAATTGAALGGGLFAFLTGGIAIAMAMVCLIGFAVSYLIGREMKPEVRTSTATKKCPECAEFIQPDANKCRYCGALIGGR